MLQELKNSKRRKEKSETLMDMGSRGNGRGGGRVIVILVGEEGIE